MLDTTRFSFVADALNATGGFAPRVTYQQDDAGLSKPSSVGTCYLVPYPRESLTKFAARAAVAVYENHLRAACERFVGYLARKPPMRDGADGPLAQAFLADANWRGDALDVFWQGFMLEARARGTMLLLMDLPAERPISLADQLAKRAVPYLTAIEPERVTGYTLDERGKFTRLAIGDTITDESGRSVSVTREWDNAGWRVVQGERIISQGTHPFGRCPVLFFSESGGFPAYGTFEQIAVLSRRIFNAQSELDEILRSQTFSLLAFQVPADERAAFSAASVAAAIGTHNMLVHGGATPAFIAPPDGPAATYMARIAALEEAIRRIAMTVDEPRSQAESGVALAIRFQALNSALTGFALRMQDLERQVWDLFAAAMGTANRVSVNWATDYQIADLQRSLDVLAAMQVGGFPAEVLRAQRRSIVQEQFATMEQDEIDGLLSAIDEPAAEVQPGREPAIDSED